ncbi:MAG: DUF2513 domain-containing protein [Leuconostoc pseudomesenteroides]|uniref:DUF2513 domain-containing protein n=1 Tax=Leuconostoc pseudomesenteroides TaxID=33968 RepID=A0A5B8T2E2_LEUPS|nr:DUF2513 domain-containing protein [Leuconostoc pseudomesenteroides]QEA41243.1 DUF2513 domain-containing protein [Leuconostoc pseudomesenteroides]
MKLNNDCVRSVLIFIEDKYTINNNLMMDDFFKGKELIDYSPDEIIYTLKKLDEAGYINIKFTYASNSLYFLSCWGITWDGHRFLDTIRDTKVWRETKSIASKFASVPLNMMSEIAAKVLTSLIEKQMGNL